MNQPKVFFSDFYSPISAISHAPQDMVALKAWASITVARRSNVVRVGLSYYKLQHIAYNSQTYERQQSF